MDEKKYLSFLFDYNLFEKKGIVFVFKVKVIVNWFKKNLIVILIFCYFINLKLIYIKL